MLSTFCQTSDSHGCLKENNTNKIKNAPTGRRWSSSKNNVFLYFDLYFSLGADLYSSNYNVSWLLVLIYFLLYVSLDSHWSVIFCLSCLWNESVCLCVYLCVCMLHLCTLPRVQTEPHPEVTRAPCCTPHSCGSYFKLAPLNLCHPITQYLPRVLTNFCCSVCNSCFLRGQEVIWLVFLRGQVSLTNPRVGKLCLWLTAGSPSAGVGSLFPALWLNCSSDKLLLPPIFPLGDLLYDRAGEHADWKSFRGGLIAV